MRSNLPQAFQFQDWVYRVISRIRQYGGYISYNSNVKQVVDIIPEQYRQSFSNMIDIKNKIIENKQQMIDEQNEIINRQKGSIKFRDDWIEIKEKMFKNQRRRIEELADLIDLIAQQQQ